MKPYFIKPMKIEDARHKNRVFVHFLLNALKVERIGKKFLRKYGEGYSYKDVSCKFFFQGKNLKGMYVKIKQRNKERDEYEHTFLVTEWLTYHVHLIPKENEVGMLIDTYYFSRNNFEKENKDLVL